MACTRVELRLLVACITMNSCGSGAVTTPSVSRPSPPPLTVTCAETPVLRCSASAYPAGDVTEVARWSAAESFKEAMDVPITPSTAVEFPAPGVTKAIRQQNVYIRADYIYAPTDYPLRSIAPHAYAVDPLQPTEPLAYLIGFTYVGTVGGAVLGGVAIEIIDGSGSGRRSISRDDNGSYMIEFMPLNAPFTVRASKPGYSTDVRTHPGITDRNGYPSNNSLHFALTPQ